MLWTHILTRSNWCDCFGKRTWSIWIGKETLINRILALIFACVSELEGSEEEYVNTSYFRFNDVARTVFNRSATDGAILFVDLEFETPKPPCEGPLD